MAQRNSRLTEQLQVVEQRTEGRRDEDWVTFQRVDSKALEGQRQAEEEEYAAIPSPSIPSPEIREWAHQQQPFSARRSGPPQHAPPSQIKSSTTHHIHVPLSAPPLPKTPPTPSPSTPTTDPPSASTKPSPSRYTSPGGTLLVCHARQKSMMLHSR